MTLCRTSKCCLSSFIAIGASSLLWPLGCASKDSKNSDAVTGGAGPGILIGAGNGGGSAKAVDGGGRSTVGTGGTKTGSGVTTIPDVDCASDVECKPHGLLCNTSTQKCVECRIATDCEGGTACVAGICGGSGGCQTNVDCASSTNGKACDAARGRCVECMAASDCPDPAQNDCVAQACVSYTACKNSKDCPGAEVCDPATSRCVECGASADCNVNDKTGLVCANSRCQPGCTSDDSCTGSNKLCNTTAGEPYCAECLANSDCPEAQYCSKAACVPDSCAAGVDQACINGGVATCNETGDGFGTPVPCPADTPCTVFESRTSCGSTTIPGNCAEITAKPCVAIPQFSGTQVVDGNGDDLCSIPGFELGFDDTAGKINQAEGETASTGSYQERATFRVAWSASHVHAYIEVADSSVNPNNNPPDIWNGDGVELMISASRNVTGLTSVDANTLHVIGNSVIGVTVKASGDTGDHSQINDPNQFKAQATTKGYAIEFMLPWPEGTTMTAGTPIYFDAALNSASKNSDDTAPRRAQALLFQADTPTATSCTGTGTNIAPFCDDRLWCPTQTQ